MEIKINKAVSILLIAVYVIGSYAVTLWVGFSHTDFEVHNRINELLWVNLLSNLSNIGNLIIGIWLFLKSKDIEVDKWTWFLIGIVFGKYALLFFGIRMILRNSNVDNDLLKSFGAILMLLILSILLSFSLPLLSPYLAKNVYVLTDRNLMNDFHHFITVYKTGFLIIINIVVAIRLTQWCKENKVENTLIWTLSTLFLGLFAVILFSELQIIKNRSSVKLIES